MLKIGIEKLDRVLNNGLPDKSITLLEGPPGGGKILLSLNFLSTGIKSGEKALFVFANKDLDEIKKACLKSGLDIDKALQADNIALIDAEGKTDKLGCSLEQLYTISHAVKQQLEKWKDQKIRLVADFISPALMINDDKAVYKLLFDLKKEFDNYNTGAMFIIEQGMHDTQSVVSLEQLCDNIIELKLWQEHTEVKHLLRVKKMQGTSSSAQFYNYWVDDSGFHML